MNPQRNDWTIRLTDRERRWLMGRLGAEYGPEADAIYDKVNPDPRAPQHSTFEKVMAWGSMLGLIGATVAVCWVKAGPVAGLVGFSLFAAVTGYMAATDRLVQK